MLRLKIIILSLIYFLANLNCTAQGSSISEGHQYLQSKDYTSAVRIYEKLVNEGYESDALFYNLGIAKYELGAYPEAVLYFEKALKRSPNSKEIRHNLDLANKQLEQDFINVESFFLVRWWKKSVLSFSIGGWTFIVLFTLMMAVIAFYYYLFGRSMVSQRTGMRIFYPLIFLFLIFCVALNARHEFLTDDSKAVLLNENILFAGPDSRSDKLYDLKAGTLFSITDSLDGWLKIELINKETGWMEADGFERI
jgi:tetratricopeptide (TPR) repeat protein